MPKANELTALKVKNAKAPGKSSKLFADGGGLYLQVTPSGAKSWVFKWKPPGAKWAREMGLGSVITYSLAEARDKALECRKLVAQGFDPIQVRDDAELAKAAAAKQATTFDQVAAACIAARRPGWKNDKHAQQWENTLKTYCSPIIGAKAIATIGRDDVKAVMDQKAIHPRGEKKGQESTLWLAKNETASRVLNRMEIVFDFAIEGKMRGDNPARRQLFKNSLATLQDADVKHHAALPYADCPAFFAELLANESPSALALAFAILTATRSNETLGARWDEVDEAAKLWIIPAERMKAGREHRVPLSPAALAIVAKAKTIRCSDFLFPGAKPKAPLSSMAMAMLLRGMRDKGPTVHGFRSSFRDWAGECTATPRDVCEMALAHTIENKAEAAYRRGDALDKRRALMQSWAEYLTPKSETNVVPIKKTAA